MAERARITSVEALEDFRATLIVYLSKARPALDEVAGDVLRTRLWLENDQRTYWEHQIRRRAKVLEQAQQALFSARLSDLREGADAELIVVQRAKRAVEEAEAKLKKVKQWSREFESQIGPLAKQLDHLRNILAIDMPHAVAYLGQTVKTLADYAGIAAAPDAAGLSRPADATASGEQGGASGDAAAPAPGAGGTSGAQGGGA